MGRGTAAHVAEPATRFAESFLDRYLDFVDSDDAADAERFAAQVDAMRGVVPDESLVGVRAYCRHLLRTKPMSDAARARLGQAIAAMPAYRTRGRLRFTLPMFVHHEAAWERLLEGYVGRPDLRFLEIGSAEGESACFLLERVLTHASARLVCIDPFDNRLPAETSRYFAHVLGTYDDGATLESLFDANVAALGASERVEKRVGTSREHLPTLAPGSFDVVYVDGDHTEDEVRHDAEASLRLLVPGGLLIFDDYGWLPGRACSTPKAAVDAFLAAHRDEVEVVELGYQAIVRKRRGPA